MINPKELRIGNYIQDQHGTILIVEGISINGIDFCVLDRDKYPLQDGWQAEPIPITERWLIDFGFEKKDLIHSDGTVSPDVYVLGKYVLDKGLNDEIDGIMFCFFSNINKPDHQYLNTIKYIQQLQNLYFALKGEELIINKSENGA